MGSGVERELGGVEDEVMLGMGGHRQARQGGCSLPHGLLGFRSVAETSPALGFLNGELHAGGGVGRQHQAGSDVVDDFVVASGDQGEPCQQLERPGHDLLVLGFLAELEGGVAGIFGGLVVAHVELNAGRQD